MEPAGRDRLTARLYAAAGVTEYWIVNLPEQIIEGHRQPGAEGYAAIFRHGPGERLRLAAFEDVALDVDDVLPPIRRP
jgi:Uma2 family endonuclease